MSRILARANRELLVRIARSDTLIAFDFDGTLAPIVAERDAAALRASTRALLTTVCGRYPCAVISGRSRADVGARLRGTGVQHVVGNHGLEPARGAARFERTARAVRALLARALADYAGVEVEDKRLSIAIHFRGALHPRQARRAAREALVQFEGQLRILGGKQVLNVLPGDAPDKGRALLRLMRAHGARTALYVGDDVTDEDVFRLAARARVLCVRVGHLRASAAPYRLGNQREIDLLLERLLVLRTADSAAGTRPKRAKRASRAPRST